MAFLFRDVCFVPNSAYGAVADEFDEGEENKLIYNDIFQRFTQLVGGFG